ncbi:hypothetical protein [Mycobacterium sp. 94-17]|nr:hypothetical protein [Mycobacterium sp. 94-17]MEB4212338.1 hypothetical protein [Mycobacterium sp. 94-17]
MSSNLTLRQATPVQLHNQGILLRIVHPTRGKSSLSIHHPTIKAATTKR